MKFRLLYLSLLIINMEATLADWQANFQPPTAAQPELFIELPDNLDSTILSSLALELNGIDVTNFLSFENGLYVYRPVEALKTGRHLLRLLLVQSDDNSYEKAQWSFTISAEFAENKTKSTNDTQIKNTEAWLKSASFSADTLTEFSHRIKDNHLHGAPNHSIISGAGNIYGQLQGENWEINTQANYLLQSDHDLALTAKTIDAGEYVLTADHNGDYMKMGVTFGHHDIGLDSLLFSSFYRRGVSGRMATQNGRADLNIFSFNSEPKVGVNDFSGLSEKSNRLTGVSSSIKPFSSEEGALQVTGIYYDGETETGGIGISDTDHTSDSSAWSLILDKTFVDGRIRFRGQYAHSQYDIDDSDAISFLLETDPISNSSLWGNPLSMTVGTKYERIDTFFQSIANQGLATDREAVNIYSNISLGNLSAELQWNRETNNVDDLSGSPTDLLQHFMWNTHYIFSTDVTSSAWLGAPYLNFSGLISGNDRDKTPDGYTGADTDNTSKSFTLEGGSNYQSFYWSASYTYAELMDQATTVSDTQSNFFSVALGWQIAETLELNTALQYNIYEEKDFNAMRYDTNITFGLASALIEDKLDLSLNYNFNKVTASGSSFNNHVINSELGWTILPASNNQPGIALALRGSVENISGNTISITDETAYQIFAVFKLTVPIVATY